MSMYDKLKALLPNLHNDGSQEIATQWLDFMRDSTEVKELLQHEGMKKILAAMREDFKDRLMKVIAQDPELKAMHRMFTRTIGLTGAEEQIERSINELIDPAEDRE